MHEFSLVINKWWNKIPNALVDIYKMHHFTLYNSLR